MIETLIIGGLVVSATVASGIPQSIYKKYKGNIRDAGVWVSGKWHKFGKLMGWSNPRKLMIHEKAKLEHAIDRLIEIVANYEAMIADLDYQINKYEDKEGFGEHLESLDKTRQVITEKHDIALLQLKERRENLKELIQFITEAETDRMLYKVNPTSKDEQEYLKHQADIDNLKKRKDV